LSRVRWFLIGFMANGLLSVFAQGPEQTMHNLRAWLRLVGIEP
jgi:hypothetical protein